VTTAIKPAPDWFDRLWETEQKRLPLFLRNESSKDLARKLVATAVEAAGSFAKSPEGMRQVIAYGRIYAAVRGMGDLMGQPDPSPEQVAAAVEKLVARVKP
jgi:hypothetical protein